MYKVLVLEDDNFIHLFYKQVFSGKEYELIFVSEPDKGPEAIEKTEQVDFVFSDGLGWIDSIELALNKYNGRIFVYTGERDIVDQINRRGGIKAFLKGDAPIFKEMISEAKALLNGGK